LCSGINVSTNAGSNARTSPDLPEQQKQLTGRSRISGKSKLAEAIRYALHRREAFEQFLHDGRIAIDSNIVERAIRPQAIIRKNSLFAGNAGGGRTWATISTLIQTAKMNGVDPLAWLTQTLERIAAGWPSSEIDALMPSNFQK
ncbi:IS66 family transposase, partial [Rhizobium rhizogenes]|uniref:IS66 family transposase n=1 Tax=Rhizobium rhizogenes TaxID=359 RepID=UPI001F24F64A